MNFKRILKYGATGWAAVMIVYSACMIGQMPSQDPFSVDTVFKMIYVFLPFLIAMWWPEEESNE